MISLSEHLKNIKDDLKRKLNVIKETSLKIPVAKAHLENKSSKEIGFIIFVGGLSIFVDLAPPINIFGVPKEDVILHGLNIPVGSIMAFFIYRELKK